MFAFYLWKYRLLRPSFFPLYYIRLAFCPFIVCLIFNIFGCFSKQFAFFQKDYLCFYFDFLAFLLVIRLSIFWVCPLVYLSTSLSVNCFAPMDSLSLFFYKYFPLVENRFLMQLNYFEPFFFTVFLMARAPMFPNWTWTRETNMHSFFSSNITVTMFQKSLILVLYHFRGVNP